jgi:hypothetical protein
MPTVRTGKSGKARVKVSPRTKGRLVFRAAKNGYSPGTARIKIR